MIGDIIRRWHVRYYYNTRFDFVPYKMIPNVDVFGTIMVYRIFSEINGTFIINLVTMTLLTLGNPAASKQLA